MDSDANHAGRRRAAIVLSGGGARGAYEAGVLSYIFEHIYPHLGPDFEFDIVTGTSVGAIHASYVAASAGLDPKTRARGLSETWSGMALDHVLRVRPSDVVGVPLRALGFGPMRRSGREAAGADVFGGLIDITPLERLVGARIPWRFLRRNLAQGRPGALCVAGTAIESGEVVVFLDGPLGDPAPWDRDPYVRATKTEITALHVRASAAIPFLFPAVRIGERYYVDGGLRLNTPLSPALRLSADRTLVVGLRRPREPGDHDRAYREEAITQPAFVLGKMLNILMLDQLEQELKRLEMINTLIDGAMDSMGTGCLDKINAAIRAKRGVEYRKVESVVVRPSQDIGAIAADSYHHRKSESRSRGVLAYVLARTAMLGTPESEADLFSYLFFDASFTQPLLELGHQDARDREEEIVRLLTGDA